MDSRLDSHALAGSELMSLHLVKCQHLDLMQTIASHPKALLTECKGYVVSCGHQ